MTDEDDNSFLLVGMEGEEEDKRKTQISTINFYNQLKIILIILIY